MRGYPTMSISRKGVEGLQRVFPDDMGSDSQAQLLSLLFIQCHELMINRRVWPILVTSI